MIFSILTFINQNQTNMKLKLLLMALVFSGFTYSTNAQDLGSLMTTLADGIKPEAFKKSWNKNKDEWISKAKSLDANDVIGAGQSLSGLIGGLKGSAFKSDARGLKANLMKGLMSGGDASSILSSMGSLVKGLDPSMLKDSFDKDGFLDKLGGMM